MTPLIKKTNYIYLFQYRHVNQESQQNASLCAIIKMHNASFLPIKH